jgi:heavy metal sensor kinase
MSIRTRLTLWYAGILIVSLGLMIAVLKYELTEQQRLRIRGEAMEPVWEEVGEVVLYYGAPTVLLLLAGGWWLLRRSLAPITALTRAAEQIEIENLNQRLPCSGNGDELDRLTAVFNAMTRRLEDSIARVREFTLHASHELKTPLTVMRAELESALRDDSWTAGQRELFANQLEEIQRLTKIVDGLSILAKADQGQMTLNAESVRLDELVRDSFADAQILAEPRHVKVQLATCEPIAVRADPHRLRQLLLNLTDNAIKYNEADGHVTMELRRTNGTAELTITNTGPGIAPEKLPRVFDRFFRADPAHRSDGEGCGLGLSIAQWIVRAHGGDISIASQPNLQTSVTVHLPAAEPGPSAR